MTLATGSWITSTDLSLTDWVSSDRLLAMEGTQSVYLDIAEYERTVAQGSEPETWCTHVEGYWVQVVPAIVYELEYRGLLTAEETLSVYIERKL